jgi:two-component system LytT family sensor kinase
MTKLTTSTYQPPKTSYLFRFRRIDYMVILGMQVVGVTVRAILLPDMAVWFHVIAFFSNTAVILFVWEFVRFLNRYLDKKMPYENGLFKRIALQTWLCLLLVYTIISIVIFLLIPLFIPSFSNLISIATAYIVVTLITIIVNTVFFGNHFFEAWKKAIIDTERLQKERALVQYDNLKNQLNPHFLFNSLTSLNSLIFENQDLASRFLQQLSKVYRYVLQNKEKELVSLETEVNFIKNYIFLLETRFGPSLSVEVKIADNDLDKGIVPVTLQILVENAIKHNIISEDLPLHISIFTENGVLCVKNTLQKKNIVETSNGQGMANMKTLYGYITDRPLEIIEKSNTFNVMVPLVEK